MFFFQTLFDHNWCILGIMGIIPPTPCHISCFACYLQHFRATSHLHAICSILEEYSATYILRAYYLCVTYILPTSCVSYIYICIYLYATCEYVLPIYYSYDHIAA